MITHAVRSLRDNTKEYILLLVGLVAQSFFGYLIVSNYSYSAASQFSSPVAGTSYFLFALGYIAGCATILYIGFLYLKRRSDRALHLLIMYVGIFFLAQIIVALLMGLTALIIHDAQLHYAVSTFSQYLLRYLVLVFAFLNVSKMSIKTVNKQVLYGFIATCICGLIQAFLTNNDVVHSLFESLIYFSMIMYLHLVTVLKHSMMSAD